MALDGNGTAHAIWLDHRGLAKQTGASAGLSGKRDHAAHDGVAMAQKSSVYYAAVTNGAPAIERELAKGVCYCCKTAFVAGPGGALYAAWRHVYPGNFRDMAFAASRDGGRSFSAPVRVSEDGWAINGCPDDGPAMAVDAEGAVHLVWPTVVGGENPEGALVYASTRDGRTFSPRLRLPTLGSPKPSHPQIAVDRGGRLVVAWDELVQGRRVAAAREVKVRPGRDAELGAIIRLASEGPSMYPVLAPTATGWLAVWRTGGETAVIGTRVLRLP